MISSSCSLSLEISLPFLPENSAFSDFPVSKYNDEPNDLYATVVHLEEKVFFPFFLVRINANPQQVQRVEG